MHSVLSEPVVHQSELSVISSPCLSKVLQMKPCRLLAGQCTARNGAVFPWQVFFCKTHNFKLSTTEDHQRLSQSLAKSEYIFCSHPTCTSNSTYGSIYKVPWATVTPMHYMQPTSFESVCSTQMQVALCSATTGCCNKMALSKLLTG